MKRNPVQKILCNIYDYRVDWFGFNGDWRCVVGCVIPPNDDFWCNRIFIALGRMDGESDYDLYCIGI